jgi:hypothetical protein
MRTGAELGAGFAFAIVLFSYLLIAQQFSIQIYGFTCAKHVKSQYGVCTMLAPGIKSILFREILSDQVLNQ